jgi:hypothetical protein
VALLCTLLLAGCGGALPEPAIPHNTLEGLIVNPFPVYWLGASFHGMPVSEARHDPSGGFSLQYGDCLEGGQGTCVPPLRVVTSADNSFLPGGAAAIRQTIVRGVPAELSQQGRTVIIPTGPVVVDIYARTRSLAAAAAETAVPINEPGTPGGELPAPLPDTGYGSTPLPSQEPKPLHPVR